MLCVRIASNVLYFVVKFLIVYDDACAQKSATAILVSNANGTHKQGRIYCMSKRAAEAGARCQRAHVNTCFTQINPNFVLTMCFSLTKKILYCFVIY